MKYVLVSDGDPAVDQLAEALVEQGKPLLHFTQPTLVNIREIVRFDPDIFVVRTPAWHELPPPIRLTLDLAAFGQRPVVALLTVRELHDSGRPDQADDILPAPYSPERLVAKARRLVANPRHSAGGTVFRYGNVTVNPAARTVHIGGRLVELTFGEFEVLQTLCRNPGHVLSRQALVQLLPGERNGPRTMRAVDVHMARLRQKLEGAHGLHIETVRRVGYRLSTSTRLSQPVHG